MIKRSENGRLGLIVLAVLLILFGGFVLTINLTLFYKGIDAVNKTEQVAAKDVVEKKLATAPVKSNFIKKHLPEKGERLGKLYIPKLKIAIPIFHGTTSGELQKGVGHVIGTAFPGESNNSVLTGHRDTVFRQLGNVTEGDILKVESGTLIYTYKVRKVRVVGEDDLTVIVPKRKATLTISTCYPFTYIGPAKQRYVLVADLIRSEFKRV